MPRVRCYHLYIRDQDRYDNHHDLCDDCVESFTIDENSSLHDSGFTKRPCEICGESDDGE